MTDIRVTRRAGTYAAASDVATINTPSTTLKMAVVPPMPRASVTTATAENIGLRKRGTDSEAKVVAEKFQHQSGRRNALI